MQFDCWKRRFMLNVNQREIDDTKCEKTKIEIKFKVSNYESTDWKFNKRSETKKCFFSQLYNFIKLKLKFFV